MARNIKERLHWSVVLPPPEPGSHRERWLRRVKLVQSKSDLIGIASPQPENPEVIRCVRGFVAWKFSGNAPEPDLPSEQEPVSQA
jgi:hypothetical protein